MAFKHSFKKAQKELDSDKKDSALWAKAIALSNGDEEKTKYKYIELRANEIDFSRIKRGRLYKFIYCIVLLYLAWLVIYELVFSISPNSDILTNAIFSLFLGIIGWIGFDIIRWIFWTIIGGRRITNTNIVFDFLRWVFMLDYFITKQERDDIRKTEVELYRIERENDAKETKDSLTFFGVLALVVLLLVLLLVFFAEPNKEQKSVPQSQVEFDFEPKT